MKCLTFIIVFLAPVLVTNNVMAQGETEIDVFVTEDSLTVFLPGTGPKSLEGVGFEVVIAGERQNFFLEDYPAFETLYFDAIPAPICFHITVTASTGNVPGECAGVATLTQTVPPSDIFWYASGNYRTLLVIQRAEQLGLCPAGNPRCPVIIAATPPPIGTPPTQTPTPTGIPGNPAPTRVSIPPPDPDCMATHTVLLEESQQITFTSGSGVNEKGRQCLVLEALEPGDYELVLENGDAQYSGSWLIWDYIGLHVDDNEVIWAVGESETPNNYAPSAFNEFCDPNSRSNCLSTFIVGETESFQFTQEINDHSIMDVTIAFSLKEPVEDVFIVLSTLYSTHDGGEQLNMNVTLSSVE